jgi:hypothetical protein
MSYEGEGIFTSRIPGYDRVLKTRTKRQSTQPAIEDPQPEQQSPKSAATEPKPKRPYRRRETPTILATNAIEKPTAARPEPTPHSVEEPSAPMPKIAERFSSFGLEYIQALARLLELLTEPSRERLVLFIIDAKIV